MRITLNIEKRYVYAIFGLLLMIIGIIAVAAYNSGGTGGNPAVFGHSADEVGNGEFPGNYYDFIQGNLLIGGWGNNKPGQLQLRGGQSNNNNAIVIRNDQAGNLGISKDAVNDYFIISNTGKLTLKDPTIFIDQSPNKYLYLQTANDFEGGLRIQKQTVDANHILWSLSHRANNQDLIIYGFDGTTYWNGIKFTWADKSVTLDSLKGSGNDYVCADPNGKLFRSNTAC